MKKLDSPQKVKTTAEELEVLSHLKGTVEWSIQKRIMQRMIDNLKTYAFNLPYSLSAEELKTLHREATARAQAYKALVIFVEKAAKSLEKKNG